MVVDFREFERWMAMARRTLRSARVDMEAGDFNWACFKAHQAAESAIKALLYGIGKPVRGHSLTYLMGEVAKFIEVKEEVFDLCRYLDKLYVPTRYVDSWSEGVPYEYFAEKDAEEAMEAAERVISFIEGVWRSLRGGRG